MTACWAVGGLLGLVATILFAGCQPIGERVFRWLPAPLWCYLLPLVAVSVGWLPAAHPAYRALTNQLLPIALSLLLLGVDLPALRALGGGALLAAAVGALGIMLGTVGGFWLLRDALPAEAWKGVGALSGTWTGGTMNLLSLRLVLEIPEAVFAPLIIVDAAVAYGWMALLVAVSAFQQPIDQWLHAAPGGPMAAQAAAPVVQPLLDRGTDRLLLLAGSLGLTYLAAWLAARLPPTSLISSASGWTVLLVSGAALLLSLYTPLRRLGAGGTAIGYPCLYLVLAATGAQANWEALRSAPAWLGVGLIAALVHGGLLLLIGRLARIPLGVLATASQANIGGVVSAPLVAAVYDQRLAPVGLLLAVAGNALGTYFGWWAAVLARTLR